jgi:hypothetical protein
LTGQELQGLRAKRWQAEAPERATLEHWMYGKSGAVTAKMHAGGSDARVVGGAERCTECAILGGVITGLEAHVDSLTQDLATSEREKKELEEQLQLYKGRSENLRKVLVETGRQLLEEGRNNL